MKLVRIGMPGEETPAVLGEDGAAFDLRGLTADIDGAFLASGGTDRAARALAQGGLPLLDITGLRISTWSYGPTTVEGSFRKTTGRSGTGAPVSSAWSR